MHNLTFMAELMRGIRTAVEDGSYDSYRNRVMAGSEPFGVSHEG
jgi:queuine/archaeosine tRNA-ribosyltransferase